MTQNQHSLLANEHCLPLNDDRPSRPRLLHASRFPSYPATHFLPFEPQEEFPVEPQQSEEDNVVKIQKTTSTMSRKRICLPEQWKRNIAKKSRYQPKIFPNMPQCKRSGNTFKCKNLSMQDVRRAHQKFYERPNRESQNNFILQHITVSSPKPSDSKKQLITKFNISMRRDSKTENVRVCREAFLSILQVGRDRVHRLCEQFFKTDLAPLEKRGGDRRTEKYKEKKEAIMTHIKTFVPLQSHYSRGRKCMRLYLDSDLSIKKCGPCLLLPIPISLLHTTITELYFVRILTLASGALP